MYEEVINKAKEFISQPDVILNLNNAKIMHASEKGTGILGIPEKELIEMSAYSLSDLPLNEAKKLTQKEIRISSGTKEYPIKCPNGTMLITIRYYVFEHNLIFN